MNSLGETNIVLGTMWGNEGKAKITNLLASTADIVLRCTGGDNDYHTVYYKDEKVVLSLIPTAILNRNVTIVFGNGAVINPEVLIEEMEKLKKLGVNVKRIYVSTRAHLIFPYHLKEDKLTENNLSAVYKDKMNRTGLRVIDMFAPYFEERVRKNVENKNEMFKKHKIDLCDAKEIIKKYNKYRKILQPHVIDTIDYLRDAAKRGKKIVVEGTEGANLDVDLGEYPICSVSNTTIGGILTGSGLNINGLNNIVGVCKTYSTKMTEGPFVTELKNEIGDLLREKGQEYVVATEKPRRCGWLDLVVLSKTVFENGINLLALNNLDTIGELPEFKVCVAYYFRGRRYTTFTDKFIGLENLITPVYKTLKGGFQVEGITDYENLPKEAKTLINLIEKQIGVPIIYIGTGPKNENIIKRPTKNGLLIK